MRPAQGIAPGEIETSLAFASPDWILVLRDLQNGASLVPPNHPLNRYPTPVPARGQAFGTQRLAPRIELASAPASKPLDGALALRGRSARRMRGAPLRPTFGIVPSAISSESRRLLYPEAIAESASVSSSSSAFATAAATSSACLSAAAAASEAP